MHVCPELGQHESLRSLLPEALIQGADDIGLSGCACDSRKVKAGDLFVALSGEKYDGLNFVAEARKMHAGDVPERSIYGEAKPDEARALLEDGVPVAPLPFMPQRKVN